MSEQHEWFRGPQWVIRDPRRATLEPMLREAALAWRQLELVSVSSGVRPSAVISVVGDDLAEAYRAARTQGLVVVPLIGGRAAVCSPMLADEWIAAQHDDHHAGRLLGYPECCQRHFDDTWGVGRTETYTDTAGGPWELNLGLRWVGVRAVPHLPCSGGCVESLTFARSFLEAGRSVGVNVAPLESALKLPLSYSRVNGVGIVDAGAFRVVVGAEDPPESWADNGFSSPEVMEKYHAAVAAVVNAAAVTSAVDLGCGDGALLERIRAGRPGDWFGVERDRVRVIRAHYRHPALTVIAGRIEDLPSAEIGPFDVMLLMPGRLLEMPPEMAALVRAALPKVARRIIAYTYDGCDLKDLCEKTGLALAGPVTSGEGVSAAEATCR